MLLHVVCERLFAGAKSVRQFHPLTRGDQQSERAPKNKGGVIMKNLSRKLVAAALLVLVAACTAPIHNIDSEPVITQRDVTLEEVKQAIITAGTGLGWDMIPQEDGRITGKLYIRTHVAVVDITYTTEEFSITYVDSTNLKYDGKVIHRNYNNWVQNLENRIQVTVGAL